MEVDEKISTKSLHKFKVGLKVAFILIGKTLWKCQSC